MAITDRNLKVGTKLVASYRKQTYHAEVVAGEDGKLRYRLSDGREFKSPSSAGTAITGKACNGWSFWSVAQAGEETQVAEEAYHWANDCANAAATEAAQAAETAQVGPATTITDPEMLASLGLAAPTQEQGEATARFRRVPNQRGVPEGQLRLYCNACQRSFNAPADQQPEACPQGHRPDGADANQEVVEG